MEIDNAAYEQPEEAAPAEPKDQEFSITHDSARKTFEELSEVYRNAQSQIAKNTNIIRLLTGEPDSPGTLWRLVEIYGNAFNRRDKNEYILRHLGETWTIRRTNGRYVWDCESAVELFRLAYAVHVSDEGSPKQADSFSAFKSMLETLLDTKLSIDDSYWWRIIDDAADLFKTAVVRTLRVEAIESVADELPELLVKALCRKQPPEYGLQVTLGDHDSLAKEVTSCCKCTNFVDDEDFYCKYCGTSLGRE